jgi:hypothetical protein
MKPWSVITRLLVIFAIVGIVLAPFTAPAVAGGRAVPMAMTDTGTDMASADDMAMAEMPCCPPAVPDCQKGCPLATLCLAKFVQGILPVGAVSARLSIAVALLPGNDAAPNTLAPLPPPRPPQA